MAFTYVGVASGYDYNSVTSVATSTGTLNVAAGDVLVCLGSWNDGTGGTLGCSDGGSNTFTVGAEQHEAGAGSCFSAIGYILDAAANATATFTFVHSTAQTGNGIVVLQFRPDSGHVTSLDPTSSNPAWGSGASGGTLTSGALTTTGNDTIVVGLARNYEGGTWSSEAIGGTAATAVAATNNKQGAWYRILTEGISSGSATAAQSVSNYWVCGLIGISASATSASQSVTPSISASESSSLSPSASSSISQSFSSSESQSPSASPSTTVNLEQEGFRFRKDDGDETTATWLGDQDANVNILRNTNYRVRFVVNALSGDAPSTQFKLQYKKTSDEVWLDMPSSE